MITKRASDQRMRPKEQTQWPSSPAGADDHMPNPFFEGDTAYSRREVLEKRESKSRPDVGIVRVKTTGFKHDGSYRFFRTFMVYKRGHVPQTARTRIPEPKQ